jgi:hypothetical protein
MAYSCRLLSLVIFLFIFHYSFELRSSTNAIINGKYSRDLSLFIHPIYFISHICRREKQYPLKMTRKYCSQKQRDKRVGWTITV